MFTSLCSLHTGRSVEFTCSRVRPELHYLQAIKPELYTEALQFLDGKRRLNNMFRQAIKLKSSLCQLGLIGTPCGILSATDQQ